MNNETFKHLVEGVFGGRFEESGAWLMPTAPPTIEQGWKIHISATIASASEVLSRVIPVFIEEGVAFKVIATPAYLADLNSGASGYAQAGKFLTVYPESDTAAVDLATKLDSVTQGLPGPRVITDRRLRRNSLVSYRYGGFVSLSLTDDLGQTMPAIRDSEGHLIPDERLPEYKKPDWVTDPFEVAGIVEPEFTEDSKLFNGYLVLSVLSQNAKGGVYLVLDPASKPPRMCVMKEAREHTGNDLHGNDSKTRLNAEVEFLRLLRPAVSVPEVYELFEHDGNSYLVMEHVEGDTLEEHIVGYRNKGGSATIDECLRVVSLIAESLADLHKKNIVYRDLKPSNLVISESLSKVHLIDFELAYTLSGSQEAYGWGTPGYTSPQQAAQSSPSFSDDIYALGATIYFYLTGTDPLYVGDETGRRLALELMRPDVGASLSSFVEQLMSPEPAERPTAEHAGSLLQKLRGSNISRRVHRPMLETTLDYMEVAKKAADRIVDEAEKNEDGGVWWPSTASNFQPENSAVHIPRDKKYVVDLHNGAAGIGLFLARIGRRTQDKKYIDTAQAVARQVVQSLPELPGLHFGKAGVAAFLLELFEATSNQYFFEQSISIANDLTATSSDIPDVTHGLAGIGLLHLRLAQHSSSSHIEIACRIADRLMHLSEQSGRGVAWRHPPGPHSGLSGEVVLGLAHGNAGIAYFFSQIWEMTKTDQYLNVAIEATRVVLDSAVLLQGNRRVNWPLVLDVEVDSSWFYWCHGAVGIGLVLLEIWRSTEDKEVLTLVQRAAETIAETGLRGGGAACHGLPGNGTFLLRASQILGEKEYLLAAYRFADLLKIYARYNQVGPVWPAEHPSVITSDYMVGNAGVADFFLLAATAHLEDCPKLRIPVL